MPSPWDFPTRSDERNWRLPEVRTDTWGGFVFVNLDPGCRPLTEYLEILPEHMATFGLEDRYKAAHVSQVVPCNWKIALEAFVEAFHVSTTHPQTIKTYDIAAQCDVWPGVDHTNRLIQLGSAASPSFRESLSESDIATRMLKGVPEEFRVDVAPGMSSREVTASAYRKAFSAEHHRDLSELSDSDVLDQVQYFCFPNVVPWATVVSPLVYRFRPYGNSPDFSLMEVMFLLPKPDDGSEFTVAEENRIEPGTKWADVPGLRGYGPVIDQDMPNLARLQKGLHATRKPGVTFARYQESRIRHFHQTLQRYVQGEK
jgi:phenylpropionate dioxygenase-like ring-hydroxylating dioxygenase large terminal subunit